MPPVLTIAVFGGAPADDGTLALAEQIGSEITSRGHVVLTGGDGTAPVDGCTSVKDCALAGAEQAAHGPTLAWIGVSRTTDPQAPTRSASGHGIVLRPGFSHARNYVEAVLCDVAVALPGGRGTRSEIAFCLAGRRPVVLVGEDWHPDDLAPQRRRDTLRRLHDDVEKRVLESRPHAPWSEAMWAAARRLVDPALALPPVAHFAAPEAAPIVDRAVEMAAESRD